MDIRILTIKLESNKISPRDVPKIRGYIAKKFPEFLELHNHIEGNKFKYGYPMVQYKAVEGVLVVIGINEYAVKLIEAFYDVKEIDIGNSVMEVFEKAYKINNCDFGITENYNYYRFISPWMALNQENYQKYICADDGEKVELLKKILTGNLLSMSKYLEYRVEKPICVLIRLEPVQVNFKNNKMIAFKGEFMTNFLIPDYLGLGKSVSRGFGTIVRIRDGGFR